MTGQIEQALSLVTTHGRLRLDDLANRLAVVQQDHIKKMTQVTLEFMMSTTNPLSKRFRALMSACSDPRHRENIVKTLRGNADLIEQCCAKKLSAVDVADRTAPPPPE